MIFGLRASEETAVPSFVPRTVSSPPAPVDSAVTRLRCPKWVAQFFVIHEIFAARDDETVGRVALTGPVSADTLDLFDDQFVLVVPKEYSLCVEVENIDLASHGFLMTGLSDPCCLVCADCRMYPEIGRQCKLRSIRERIDNGT